MRRVARFAPLSLVIAACAGPSGNSGFSPGGNAGADGGPAGDGGSSTLGGSSEDGGGGAAATRGCSADLQSVVDGSGVLVRKCPADQGCKAGACVPACDAAAASHGSVGCDFVVATPSFYPAILPPCFAVFLANNWPKPAKIQVSRDGAALDVTKFGRIPKTGIPESSWDAVPADGLPPNQVAVLFLSADPQSQSLTPLTCPVPPAIPSATAVIGSGLGKAFHITTDLPVSGYDILPYGGAQSYLPSAELLLPTSAWGKNYFGIVPLRGTSAPQWGQIVAAEDNTNVTILPSVDLPGSGGAPSATANVATTLTLNAGQYVQWQDTQEMSSSVISSDKPVAFVGGQGYDCYSSKTSGGGGCDSAHQQMPPVSALGFDYAVAPYATRQATGQPESIPYRLVGAVDGTTLTYDPPVQGAPGALSRGQVVDFETVSAFRVKSQDKDHPFYVGQVMAGCKVAGGSRDQSACMGDEEFVNLLPPAQFLPKYVFFTDPTYTTTNLVLTRQKTPSGFKDVTVDCHGVVGGWKPIDGSGEFETANIDIVFAGAGVKGCENGQHVAQSDGPFGLMVWGLALYASYAYPAGGNVAPINTVIVPPTPK